MEESGQFHVQTAVALEKEPPVGTAAGLDTAVEHNSSPFQKPNTSRPDL